MYSAQNEIDAKIGDGNAQEGKQAIDMEKQWLVE